MMHIDDINKLTFWAKTTRYGKPGIDVYHHMQNVAAVAKNFASSFQYFLEQTGIALEEASLLAGLHDIGKISPQFQRKCDEWLIQHSLKEEDIRNGWKNYQPGHAQVSQYTIERLLQDHGLDRQSSTLWAAAIGAHHGRIAYNGERGLAPEAGMNDDEWEQKRREIAEEFIRNTGKIIQVRVKPDNPILWWIGGMTTIADWIGSDERFFSPGDNLPARESELKAKEALDNIGFTRPSVKSGKYFFDVFGFEANPLQESALEYIKTPGIYMIEAPMGMGKTEAALAAAYQLLNDGTANGIYFALPTQTTSNRIHLRMANFINRICDKPQSTRLIHGNSWLVDDKIEIPDLDNTKDTDAEEKDSSYDWFSSPKRALLSPFGVGTVDQALMGVIAVKHFFVRQFALARKVVILDEVHSYDMYTGMLINNLCQSLVKLGATVIVLSATLTVERRLELLDKNSGEESFSSAYPLLSGKTSDGRLLKSISVDSPESKEIAIRFIEENTAIHETWQKAHNGTSVVWICNTVARSQEIYETFKQKENGSSAEIGLLHSRFPFFRREELEQKWLEKLGKRGDNRGPCILVATQVVEQSVDIDADLIVTELAPTDMLLQRMGRLWRHERGTRPVERPELWILREGFDIRRSVYMKPSEIRKALESKAYVYDPYVLLRTYAEWRKRDTILIPGDIRSILEATYSENNDTSESWNELKTSMLERKKALVQKAMISSNIWRMPSLQDEEEVMTRYNSQPTVALILARARLENSIVLLDGSEIPRKEDEKGKKNPNIGRAIQRNLVKVPEWVFEEKPLLAYLPKYVSSWVTLSVPNNEGFLEVNKLKNGVRLKWSFYKGLEIIRSEGVLDESSE
jgi:CRISPR-associated endonuclease/helicase Cas3